MKTLTISLAALGIAAAALPATAANAQPWQTINQRQRNLDARIDQGVHNGALTRAEAMRLRGEFRGLANLEERYRRGGLNQWERNDLNRRFDMLSQRVRWDKNNRRDRH